MLACARIGAPHSVVFGGFSRRGAAHAASRTPRPSWSSPPTAATGAASPRRSSPPSTAPWPRASRRVEHVLVVRRTGQDVEWTDGRDVWWHDAVDRPRRRARGAGDGRRAPAVHPLHLGHDREAEGHPAHHRRLPDPGRLHAPNVFDLHPETDVYWCTADIGWVTGHSYIVYGPLANGATQVIYEGTPDTPHQGRWWEIIEKYGVTILYTAPTAIRTFMKWGEQIPAEFDLSSLRVLGQRRRADQPRGVDVVPPGHRRRPAPRSSTPGGRPRRARS